MFIPYKEFKLFNIVYSNNDGALTFIYFHQTKRSIWTWVTIFGVIKFSMTNHI